MKNYYYSLETKKDYFYKSLYFIIILLFCSTNSSAQLTIPATNNYTETNNRPIGAYYRYDRTLSVYKKTEMNIPTGSNIIGIRYFVQTASNPVNVPMWVYLYNTTSNSFTASSFNSATSGFTYVGGTLAASDVVAGKWVTIPFTTPFTYTGNNLEILVGTDIGYGTGANTTDKTFRWHNATDQTQVWNSNLDPSATGTGTVLDTRPNIRILYNTPGAPGALSFDYSPITMLENRNQVITVNRVGGSVGAISVNYATSDGIAIAGNDYNATSGTLSWADGDMSPKSFTVTTLPDTILDQNETFSITLSNPIGTTIQGNASCIVTISDVLPPMSGTYTVGTGGNFPSLTNDGGIFQAINQSVDGVSGSLTINIISDLNDEIGKHALNEIAGNPPVLIQPFGGPRTIKGATYAGYSSLIKFSGTDNVTINGSTSGTSVNSCLIAGDPALRELTIQNQTSYEAYGIIGFLSGNNGAKNNTVKNVNVIGHLGGNYGIHFTGKDNDGNRVENCSIKRVNTGVYSYGESLDNQNIGTVITQNNLSATGTDKITRFGVLMYHDMNPVVSYNKVYVENPSNEGAAGLALGSRGASSTSITSGGITGATVNNNVITGAICDSSTGYSSVGITISGAYTGLPNTIQNNMVSNVRSQAKSPSIVAGIFVVGAVASVTKLYNNTISLSGNRGSEPSQYPSYGIALAGLDPIVEMKNNIMSTTQIATGGGAVKTYAFGTASTTFDSLVSDNNVFYSAGVQSGGIRSGSLNPNAGTSYATLAAWRTATSRDDHSVQVAPVFVSATDLHLDVNNNPLIESAGTPIATITTDIDCQLRNTVNPTIGADEISVGTLGTNNFALSEKIRFYPNPVKSILNIENDSPISKVEVFNLTGQVVLNQTVNTKSAQINLSNLSSGIYLVRISYKNNIETFKIIKD